MFRRILVGYTGSELSRKALSTALELAALSGCEVIAGAVVETPPFPGLIAEVDRAVAAAEEALVPPFAWARSAAERSEVPITLRTRVGPPAESLVRMAEEEGCDLIVLGHRERPWVQLWWSDSIGERVLRRAPCSLLMIR